MIKKSSRDKRFLRSFLSYYILILIIPILVGIGLNIYSQQIIHSEVTKANKVVIEQLKLSMDNRIESVRSFTMQLAADESLRGIINTKGDLTTGNRYTLLHVTNTFKAYNLSNDFIKDFFVYCLNSNTVVGPHGYSSMKNFTDDNFYEIAWYFPKWYNIVRAEHRGEIYPIYLENTKEIEHIVYLQSLPYTIFNEPNATIAMRLDLDYFDSLVQGTSENEREDEITYAVIDSAENIIFSKGESYLFESDGLKEMNRVREGFVTINYRNDYYVYSADSDIVDWYYVVLIPTTVFNKKVSAVRMISFSSLALIIVLGIIAIGYIKKRRYDPLVSTLELLSDDQTFGTDAYMYLKSTVEETLSDKSTMEENMLMNRDYLQSYFLMRLISQKIINEDESVKLMDYYGVDLNHTFTSVAIFYLNTQDDTSIRENESFVEFLEMIQKTFSDQFVSEVQVKASLYPVYFNGMLVCLINYSQVLQDDNGIISWLNGFRIQMEELDISVSLSKPKIRMTEISLAYDEALQALERKLVYGKSGVSQYTSTEKGKKITRIMYYQYEDNFTQLLDSGEYEKAKNIIKNLFNLVLNQERMNLNIVKCRMFGIINILMNSIEKLNLPSDCISFEVVYTKLVGFYSIEDLQKEIIRTIDVISKHRNVSQSVNGDTLIDQVITYVDDHYFDPSICVSQIADQFKVDMPMLSRKFKKEKNINLSDYLHMKKLEKAKPLIIDSDKTIKEIAIKCGYINSDVFIRVFKRYEGITPGKYRQNSKKQK